ncbi:MAG: hypothetical protein M1828_007238 [Chrysothrix sp. TS-e1954]|nr:MAG: hypothetical protein M1828_007238 [Chrysothrix sp. TS-e1954]
MAINLVAGNQLGQNIIIVDSVGAAICIVVVALRLWAISLRGRNYRIHDYLAIAALPIILGFTIGQIIGVVHGGDGIHTATLATKAPTAVVTLLKTYLAVLILWLTASVLIKLSILFLYLDLFGENGRFRIACYGTMGLVFAYFVAVFCYFMLLCHPLSKQWNQAEPGHCSSLVTEQLTTAVLLMALDLVIIFLPMPTIWDLKMSLKKKISVSLVFGLGLIITIVNILRIYYTTAFDAADFSYSLVSVGILAGLEIFFGLIIACAPTLQPIIAKFPQPLTGSGKGSKTLGRTGSLTTISGRNQSDTIGLRDRRHDTKNFSRLDDEELNGNPDVLEGVSAAERGRVTVRGSRDVGNGNEGIGSEPDEVDQIRVTRELQFFASPR